MFVPLFHFLIPASPLLFLRWNNLNLSKRPALFFKCTAATPEILPSATLPKFTRRALLISLAISASSTSLSATSNKKVAYARVRLADEGAYERPPVRLAPHLQYYDFRLGDTTTAPIALGTTIAITYTLSSTGARYGYKIDSNADDTNSTPLIFTVGDPNSGVIRGIDKGVIGMYKRGKRRLIVGKEWGYRGVKNEKPVPKGFAEYQRFKNLFLNRDRQYVPDVVVDVDVIRVVRR